MKHFADHMNEMEENYNWKKSLQKYSIFTKPETQIEIHRTGFVVVMV